MAATGPEVIVADQDPGIRLMLRRALAGLGYAIRDLESPGDALDYIERQRADLLVLIGCADAERSSACRPGDTKSYGC